MKSRMMVIGLMALILGWASLGLAADRPNQYQPLNPKLAQAQVDRLKKPKVTLQDLNSLSAQVHQVDLSGMSPDVLPASDRPTGSVQLDKVLIIDPSK